MNVVFREGDKREVQEEQLKSTFTGRWLYGAKESSGWLITLGILEIILGAAAVAVPFIAGVAAGFALGILLLVSGVSRGVRVLKAHSFGQGSWTLLTGLLGVMCGLLVLIQPLLGLASLALLFAAYFFAQGAISLLLALNTRGQRGWGWLAFNGAMALLLALIIAAGWPLSGVWAVGTLVGIDMLISGFTALSIGSGARRDERAPAGYDERYYREWR